MDPGRVCPKLNRLLRRAAADGDQRVRVRQVRLHQVVDHVIGVLLEEAVEGYHQWQTPPLEPRQQPRVQVPLSGVLHVEDVRALAVQVARGWPLSP